MAEQSNGYVIGQVDYDHQEIALIQQNENEITSEDSDTLDCEKRNNFIARALSESLRMAREAEGSREKKDRLRAKFGRERMSQLKIEHSADVLAAHDSGACIPPCS